MFFYETCDKYQMNTTYMQYYEKRKRYTVPAAMICESKESFKIYILFTIHSWLSDILSLQKRHHGC